MFIRVCKPTHLGLELSLSNGFKGNLFALIGIGWLGLSVFESF